MFWEKINKILIFCITIDGAITMLFLTIGIITKATDKSGKYDNKWFILGIKGLSITIISIIGYLIVRIMQ